MQARDLIDVLEEADQYVPQELYAMTDHFDAWIKRCAKKTSTDCRRKDSSDGDKTVIILCKRDRVEYLTGGLTLGGFKCDCIHECLEASDQQRALNDFRRGRVPILIATDLESRALDVEDLTHMSSTTTIL
ncbi:hypothetical protein HPB49_000827 [Dermacentor silvarum]|uniref:Uncharacterized protein n=1 Tax=Dermacentor silvarum TaxID=543639 RepID=A0ACB8D222_DERSI|nr:hypothetical protein HPB49_000827 [Dermacentor silvarum]